MERHQEFKSLPTPRFRESRRKIAFFCLYEEKVFLPKIHATWGPLFKLPQFPILVRVRKKESDVDNERFVMHTREVDTATAARS